MKVRLPLPLVLLVLVGCSDPTPRDLDTFVRGGDLYLDPETMTPYSGPVFRLYPGTQDLKERGNLKDGVWSGPYEYYFSDGQLWFSGSHDLPRNRDDLVESEGLFLDPETMEPYTGPTVDFLSFQGVQLQMRGTYSNGELDGPIEFYWDNGQLRSKGFFSNGEPDGPWQDYYENGQLEFKGSYSNGKPDGPWEFNYNDGQLSERGSLSKGEKCGEWFEDGKFVTYPPCPNG